MTRQLREKIAIMRVGGEKLGRIKQELAAKVAAGVTFEELEHIAQRRIKEEGATPSFSTVPGYSYATCITKNEGCCHGVPVGKTVDEGDLITIDVGLVWRGYHVDTSITVFAGPESKLDAKKRKFLEVGKTALAQAIAAARVGNSVYDISKAMQDIMDQAGYGSVYQLCGHSIGKSLHEDPQIPCVAYPADKRRALFEGQTLAIETMYAMGEAKLELGPDGWTYQTVDGSLTGMFEETVVITSGGPQILTQ